MCAGLFGLSPTRDHAMGRNAFADQLRPIVSRIVCNRSLIP